MKNVELCIHLYKRLMTTKLTTSSCLWGRRANMPTKPSLASGGSISFDCTWCYPAFFFSWLEIRSSPAALGLSRRGVQKISKLAAHNRKILNNLPLTHCIQPWHQKKWPTGEACLAQKWKSNAMYVSSLPKCIFLAVSCSLLKLSTGSNASPQTSS